MHQDEEDERDTNEEEEEGWKWICVAEFSPEEMGKGGTNLIVNHDNDFAISAPFFPRIFLGGEGFLSF